MMKDKLIKENIIDMWRDLSKSGLVQTKQLDNFFIMECINMKDSLFNYAIETEVQDIDPKKIIDDYNYSKKDFLIWYDRRSNLMANLLPFKFQRLSTIQGMCLEISDNSRSISANDRNLSGLKVKLVESTPMLNDWILPIQHSFNINEIDANAFKNIIKYSIKELTNFFHFIAYFNHQPIATLSLYINKGCAGGYNGATMPCFRNKGFFNILIKKAIRIAAENKCHTILAQAAPQSQPLLIKHGFKTFAYYEIFRRISKTKQQPDWAKKKN